MGFFYITLTVLFTVYGQLAIRWRMSQAGPLPVQLTPKIVFLLAQLSDFWVLSAFTAAFIASLAWMAAMTYFEISYAYPFTSLSFVAVSILSILFFGELFTWNKVIGTLTIMLGLYIIAR